VFVAGLCKRGGGRSGHPLQEAGGGPAYGVQEVRQTRQEDTSLFEVDQLKVLAFLTFKVLLSSSVVRLLDTIYCGSESGFSESSYLFKYTFDIVVIQYFFSKVPEVPILSIGKQQHILHTT
jgi:hypothetical protein